MRIIDGRSSRDRTPFAPRPSVRAFLPIAAAICLSLFPGLARADYRIGPGDVIEISVWQFADISGTFMVNDRGEVRHFLIGDVVVGNLTSTEAARKITGILATQYIRDPRVKVTVKEHRNLRISILGEIKNPGMLELDREVTLLETIIKAGGPTEKAGGIATLIRDNESTLPDAPRLVTQSIDLSSLLLRKEGSDNPILRNNDVVLIPSDVGAGFADRVLNRGLNRFYVVGQVKNKGSYPYVKGYTVLNAVLDAGGLAEYADPNSAKVVRTISGKEQYIDVRLKDIFNNGDLTTNIEVLPGDLIIVPKGIF